MVLSKKQFESVIYAFKTNIENSMSSNEMKEYKQDLKNTILRLERYEQYAISCIFYYSDEVEYEKVLFVNILPFVCLEPNIECQKLANMSLQLYIDIAIQVSKLIEELLGINYG